MINETPSRRGDAVEPEPGHATLAPEPPDRGVGDANDAPRLALVLLEGPDDDAVCNDELCLPLERNR